MLAGKSLDGKSETAAFAKMTFCETGNKDRDNGREQWQGTLVLSAFQVRKNRS